MTKKYNVWYMNGKTPTWYQAQHSTREVAEKSLALFKGLYLEKDGTAKPYPNGKGYYDISNPQVVEVP